MSDNIGLDDFQTLFQTQNKLGEPSSTSQAWKQSLASKADSSKNLNHGIKSDSPPSEQQVQEAYFQLEIFYRFKPHLTESQLQALSVVIELPYDEVYAFYEQKRSQPLSHVSNGSQSDHGQGSRAEHPAKRHRGSDSSSSSVPVNSAYGISRSGSSTSLQPSERNTISRALSLRYRVGEQSQKPYECTWRLPNCQMSFATRSDWKRHEEVHCPQWNWLCTFEIWPERKTSKAIRCTRDFKRSDHLRDHLKKDHKCLDTSKVEAGRRSLTQQNPFNKQCGFCGYMARDWIDRINHIAEHFKNGKNMSEWRDPWPEDVFEEESDLSDDDDDENDNGYSDDTDNTPHQPKHTGNDGGNYGGKNVNMNLPSGSYKGSGNGYRRPGTWAIKYQPSSRATDSTESPQRRDNEPLRHEVDSPSSFWSKMRNMLKNRNSQKETSLTPSLQAANAASFEASRDIDLQGEERIELYCILCLKRVSMDPSLPSMDDYYCTCSEDAIKEHIMSVALAGLHLETPSTKTGGQGTRSEKQTQKSEKTENSPAEGPLEDAPKNRPLAARERGLAGTKPQRRAGFDDVEEQFSHSIQRWLKTFPGSEYIPELNQDENSSVKIHRQNVPGSKSEEHAESHSSSSWQDIYVPFTSGKLAQAVGSDRILHEQSLPELRQRRHDRLLSRRGTQGDR
jgi:hypothetical protein